MSSSRMGRLEKFKSSGVCSTGSQGCFYCWYMYNLEGCCDGEEEEAWSNTRVLGEGRVDPGKGKHRHKQPQDRRQEVVPVTRQ